MSSSRESERLSRQEQEDYDSSLGPLNWLAGRTRLDTASAVSLDPRGEPTWKDFRMIMKELERFHETSRVGLLVIPVGLERYISLNFSDSSWANAEKLRTEVGWLLLIAPRGALASTILVPIFEFKSKRNTQGCARHVGKRSKCSRQWD